MSEFKKIYKTDFFRYKRCKYSFIKMIISPALKSIYVGRKRCFSKSIFWKWVEKYISHKYGNEIAYDQIDEGIVLEHPYNITVATGSKLGKNCTLFKGCTIGSVRSGRKKGCPILGESVIVGVNAMVCGNVNIGNDVMIAPNSFVNFDVPDHSVVIGNPGVIHHKGGGKFGLAEMIVSSLLITIMTI